MRQRSGGGGRDRDRERNTEAHDAEITPSLHVSSVQGSPARPLGSLHSERTHYASGTNGSGGGCAPARGAGFLGRRRAGSVQPGRHRTCGICGRLDADDGRDDAAVVDAGGPSRRRSQCADGCALGWARAGSIRDRLPRRVVDGWPRRRGRPRGRPRGRGSPRRTRRGGGRPPRGRPL